MYLFTLDSHDYYGPFKDTDEAHAWAKRTAKSSYQFLVKLPFMAVALKPY